MKTQNLTDNEKIILESIATSEWTEVNGAEPETADETCGFYYVDYIATGDLSEAQTKGVVTSLVKKGLVQIQDNDDEDNFIWLTDEGFDIYTILKGQL